MSLHERQILAINLVNNAEIREEVIQLDKISFRVRTHSIGWNYELAEQVIASADGLVDAIAIIGMQRHLSAGKFRTSHPGYLRLLRAATRTPMYVADDIREFFTDWTLTRILRAEPEIFRKRKVLFHSAVASPALARIAAAGAQVYSADPLLITQSPIRLNGLRQIETFSRVAAAAGQFLAFRTVKPLSSSAQVQHIKVLSQWISEADAFVASENMLQSLKDFSSFQGKMLIVDSLDSELRSAVEEAGIGEVIEWVPAYAHWELFRTRHLSLLAAMLDINRQESDSTLELNDYVLDWFQKNNIKPRSRQAQKSLPRKCAFIIHPLDREMLWLAPGAGLLKDSPSFLKNQIEHVASRLPIFHYGSLQSVVSQSTGQEVQCDFYAMPATPKQILNMDESALYRRLLQGAELARSRGAGLIGLGAYTKVAGDAGATLSRWSPIPVTNGNSYSSATTLWAARVLVEKMNLVSTQRIGRQFDAKATIVGATGSIGRVSAMLVALVFNRIVLVANRADRLLELREDIMGLAPTCHVKISTRAEPELVDSDLVVSATSNHHGNTFDIKYVKPGAVIVDTSRPVDVGPALARTRPDVLVVEGGEVLMPGDLKLNCELGLPPPAIYACTAETILLALEGRMENFSVGKQLSLSKVKEIYKLGVKHGAQLAAIRGPLGLITDDIIKKTREAALLSLSAWNNGQNQPRLII